MSSCVPRPRTRCQGKPRALHRQIGQHIDRIADDDQVGVLLEAGRLDLIEQRQEQIDIAIDEVEPALVRLAAQAGGDDDDIAGRHIAHVAGADALVGDQAGAVQQVERLALGHVLVGVDEADAADDAAALQGIGRHAADQTAAADDADFHG